MPISLPAPSLPLPRPPQGTDFLPPPATAKEAQFWDHAAIPVPLFRLHLKVEHNHTLYFGRQQLRHLFITESGPLACVHTQHYIMPRLQIAANEGQILKMKTPFVPYCHLDEVSFYVYQEQSKCYDAP